MRVCFVLLACRTARNILADEGGKTWPPELGCDELAGFENTGVTRCRVVMVSRDNGAAEGRVGRNIDTILKGQDTGVVLPVREARTKLGGEFAGECMEGVEDKGVGRGGGGKPFREGGVDEVYKEGVGEEGDILVVGVSGGNVIWAVRKGIGGAKVFSWDVGKVKIKFREVKKPASLAAVEFLGLSEVGEVLMVSEYLDWGGGSKEIVSPGIQGSHDCEEFSVVNVIVVLGRAKHLGEIGTGVPNSVDVSLEEYSSRGVLGCIGGNGKGGGEVGELEDWLGGERLFKGGEGGVTGFIPFPGMRFLGKV